MPEDVSVVEALSAAEALNRNNAQVPIVDVSDDDSDDEPINAMFRHRTPAVNRHADNAPSLANDTMKRKQDDRLHGSVTKRVKNVGCSPSEDEDEDDLPICPKPKPALLTPGSTEPPHLTSGAMKYRGHEVTWKPWYGQRHHGTMQTRVYGPAVAASGWKQEYKTFYCKTEAEIKHKADLLLAGAKVNPYRGNETTHEQLRGLLNTVPSVRPDCTSTSTAQHDRPALPLGWKQVTSASRPGVVGYRAPSTSTHPNGVVYTCALHEAISRHQHSSPSKNYEAKQFTTQGPLQERLFQWRRQRCQQLGIPPYCLFNNRTLEGICQHQPQNLTELEQIKGMGPQKIAKYGAEILRLLIPIG